MVVYLREAHPTDGDAPPRDQDAPRIAQPQTLEQRRAIAGACLTELELGAIPTLVDELDDAVGRAYAAWPDRLYLIGTDGKVVWKCGPGPAGFDPDGLESALRKLLALDEPPAPAPSDSAPPKMLE